MVAGGAAYKLHYFPVRNLAEVIRMILHYSNQPFEEIKISMADWANHKSKMPNGKIPVLEVEGKSISESYAIARFLAKRFGLAGKNDWEEAKVNEIADFHKDVVQDFRPYLYTLAGIYEGDKDELRKDVFLPAAEKFFPMYQTLLNEGKTGFLAGGHTPTWVDFMVADFFHTIKGFDSDTFGNYPVLGRFVDKIFSLPKLKKYIKDRPQNLI